MTKTCRYAILRAVITLTLIEIGHARAVEKKSNVLAFEQLTSLGWGMEGHGTGRRDQTDLHTDG
jgi:hypothetical protein